MKAKALWVLKYLIVPFGFIWATGIISGLKTLQKTDSRDPYFTFSVEEMKTLFLTPENLTQACDSIIDLRKKQIKEVGYYDPYDYFSDLKQVRMFTVAYRHRGGEMTERHLQFVIFEKTQTITAIRDENWRNQNGYQFVGKTYQQLAKKGTMSIQEAREHWFPLEKAEREMRETQPTNWRTEVIIPILEWMLRFYLKGFGFALILFGLWRKKISQEFAQSSFISFFLCLIIWPIILGIDIRNKMSELLSHAEVISRRKKMFTLLSEQEKQLLALRKTMTFREFKIHLDELGLTRHHGLGSALIVTCFLVIVPKSVFPTTQTTVIKKDHVSVMESDYGDKNVTSDLSECDTHIHGLLPEEPLVPDDRYFKIFYSYQLFCWLYFCEFIPDIGSVPKVSNCFVRN